MALGVLEHLEQHPELDAIGVRLDLTWRWRELVVGPPMLLGFSFRGAVRQLDVRIGNDRLLDVLVHRGAPLLVTALDLHGHLGSAGELPGDLLLLQNPRLVLLGVDLHFEVVRGRPRTGAGDDLDGLAGRELPVHAGRRDADALLPSAHAQPMELRPIEQLREDPWNLLADDAGFGGGADGLASEGLSFGPRAGNGSPDDPEGSLDGSACPHTNRVRRKDSSFPFNASLTSPAPSADNGAVRASLRRLTATGKFLYTPPNCLSWVEHSEYSLRKGRAGGGSGRRCEP